MSDATSLSGAQALVTGGAGFIGSHLVEALQAEGARVRVLDDLSSGTASNLHSSAELFKGSIVDRSCVESAMKGCNVVFHLAAMVSVPESVGNPSACFEANVVGTENVIRSAVDHRVSGFIHTSSSAVYGPVPRTPSEESDPVCAASPYAASKASGELLLQSASHAHGLRGASFRLFNVFGSRQHPGGQYAAVISAFIHGCLSGSGMRIHGDGSYTRDFIPVAEVVRAFVHAARKMNDLNGHSINLGLGRPTSVAQLSAMISRAAGIAHSTTRLPLRPGDVPHSCACMSKFERFMGYRPSASLETELKHLVEWIRPRVKATGV